MAGFDLKLINYSKAKSLRYPVVLGQNSGGELEQLLSAEDLASCSKNHTEFLKVLRAKAAEKGIAIE